MKFLIFIDSVYPKIRSFFLLTTIPVTAGVIYLYIRLPHLIPTHFGQNFEVDSWGNKATLFLFPVFLLLFCLPLSKKFFIMREPLLIRRGFIELVFTLVFMVLFFCIASALFIYFQFI